MQGTTSHPAYVKLGLQANQFWTDLEALQQVLRVQMPFMPFYDRRPRSENIRIRLCWTGQWVIPESDPTTGRPYPMGLPCPTPAELDVALTSFLDIVLMALAARDATAAALAAAAVTPTAPVLRSVPQDPAAPPAPAPAPPPVVG